jgi:hypothetical protein
VLHITNIIEKLTKIITFIEIGSSTPLYVEKDTIDESNTIMVVKSKMKISEVFLFSIKLE